MNNTMNHRISLRFFYGILFCVLSLYYSIIAQAAGTNDSFWVKFIDVGQGDCTLIQCDGHYMMIDGGPSKASSKVYTILKDNGIKNIDIIIATHPDEDHIGGLSGALNYSSVGTVLSPVTTHDTKTFSSLLKYVSKQGKSLTVPNAGDVYSLGTSKVIIAGPVVSSEDTNNNSIVVKLIYGNNSFIFMGDAEEEEELSLVHKYSGFNCDVLKVGHHGSKSSTSSSLLKAANPTYAVISVGKDNPYGHPTQDVLDKLSKSGVQICRTDLHGDIVFHSDGKQLQVETEKNVSRCGTANTTIVHSGSDYTTALEPPMKQLPHTAAPYFYVLNTNTKKFHYPSCSSVGDMSSKNRKDTATSRDDIISKGYAACKICKP